MRQYGSCDSSSRIIKNTKAKNCKLKEEYFICLTSDRPVRYSYPHAVKHGAGYRLNWRSNTMTSVQHHHFFFSLQPWIPHVTKRYSGGVTKHDAPVRSMRIGWCIRCTGYSFSVYSFGSSRSIGLKSERAVRHSYSISAGLIFINCERDGVVKHDGVSYSLDGVTKR